MRLDPLRRAMREATRRLNSTGEAHLVVGNLGRADYEVAGIQEWGDRKVFHIAVPPHQSLSISPGNIKLQYIPSVSLPPPMTCGDKERPCYGTQRGRNCYAMPNMYLLRPKLRQAWNRNWHILQASRNLYFAQISAYLNIWKPQLFRFHVGGGVPDQDYFDRVVSLCRDHDSTKFLLFEKGYDMGLDFSDASENLAIVLSTWPGMEAPGTSYDGLPRAWLADDPRVPKDAVECRGGCTACEKCWNIKQVGKDVVFPRH